MKKILALMLVSAMSLTLTACGGNSDDVRDESNGNDRSSNAPQNDKLLLDQFGLYRAAPC